VLWYGGVAMKDNRNINKDNDTRKIFTMMVLIFTLMICTTGATYAYFAISATNNVMSGTAATASLTLSVTQADLKNTTNTGVMVPQREAALGTAMNSTNKCVDENNNVICKVYTVTVTNESTAAVKVKGTIKFSGNTSMPNLKWRRADSTTELGSNTSVAVGTNNSTAYDLTAGTACSVVDGDDTGCTSVSLAKSNGSATYYIVVWINAPMNNGIEQAQTDTGTWRAEIKFEGENGTGVTSTITA
jgi:hypothetical protein